VSLTLRVVHSTGYSYRGGASSSYNEARMTPMNTSDQQVLHSRVEVSPSAWTHTFTDYWGTAVTAFELHERHEHLRLVSTSEVIIDHRPVTWDNVGWDAFTRPEVVSEHAEYLNLGRLVTPADELASMAADLRAAAARPSDFVLLARDLVVSRVTYLPGVTDVHSSARDAWATGAGVCQDLTHVLIGALRSGGVPARYVSGYLMPDTEQAAGESSSGQSHAWLEYWDGGWRGLDPTNEGTVGDDHIVVGRGRDYADVSPLRGLFVGGETCDMFVEVTLTRLR